MKVLLISLFDEWCLGLRALAAYLKARGHAAPIAFLRGLPEMHDAAGEGDPEGYHVPPASVAARDLTALCDLARREQPNLIGLSLTSNFHGLGRAVTERLRKACGVPVVWGGIDATANPDLAVEHADFVCVGEGEEALLELVESLESGRDPRAIANLWVRDGACVRKNPVRPLIQDLDSLPRPDYESGDKFYVSGGRVVPDGLPEGSHLRNGYPLVAGRGCPYSCTYCCNSMLRGMYGAKGYVRARSVRGVVDEIRAVVSSNPAVGIVDFHDDVFASNTAWLREFAEIYAVEVGLPFYCYVHASSALRERIGPLKRAGLVLARLGVQSGSERILRDVYGRNTTRAQIVEAVCALREAGIATCIDLIGSNPLEREEDYRATLDLMLGLPSGFSVHPVNVLGVYRNYPIAERMRAEGVLEPWLEGRNGTRMTETNETRFWRALLEMTQFSEIERGAIRGMADDPYLREHPEIVEALTAAFRDLTFLPGSFDRRSEAQRLAQEEIAALRGSRLVRAAERARRWLSRLQG